MWLNARFGFWILLFICLFLLVLPLYIRDTKSYGMLIDGESYLSVRFAEQAKETGFIFWDNLSYGGRHYLTEQAWYLLLAISPFFMAKYLPIIFGLLSFILFYAIVSSIKPSIRNIASLFLIISPTFLYFFSTASKYVAAVFFVLLGVYLTLKNKRGFAYASFFIVGLFSVFSLLLVVLVFLYTGVKEKKYNAFFVMFAGLIFICLIYFYKIFTLGLPDFFYRIGEFSFSEFFSYYFFMLGSNFGLGFFTFVLALVGVFAYYRNRYGFILKYLFFAFAFYLSFYFKFLFFYLAFIVAFFAGAGFMTLLNREWRSKIFRFLTIFVICCGMLFTTLLFISMADNFYPNADYKEAIDFLASQQNDFTVLSDYRNGNIITYSGKKNFLDPGFFYAPNITKRQEDFNTLLSSKNLSTVELIMSEYNIGYVMIDSNIKSRYFTDELDGLLFLLTYSPLKFSLVFDNGEVEIWQKLDVSQIQ